MKRGRVGAKRGVSPSRVCVLRLHPWTIEQDNRVLSLQLQAVHSDSPTQPKNHQRGPLGFYGVQKCMMGDLWETLTLFRLK